jgi:hypothetical protein
MLSDIQEYDIRTGLSTRKDHDLAFNYLVLRSHDKFQVPDARRAAERRLQSNLEQDPFAGFAFASQHDDLIRENGHQAHRPQSGCWRTNRLLETNLGC